MKTESNARHTTDVQLKQAWILWASMLSTLPVYILLAHGLNDSMRVVGEPDAWIIRLRTLFYVIALATFPLMNGLRKKMVEHLRSAHMQPGEKQPSANRKRSYRGIVALSLILAESMALWGVVLFLLGDSLRTLYIFCALSALALFLYRPKTADLEHRTTQDQA